MSFEQGTLTFRMMALPRPFGMDAVASFAKDAAGSLNAADETPRRGWVTGRHLLDTAITDASALYGGRFRLQLREIVRKVPTALLKAQCKLEEIAYCAANERTFLKASERAEIRQEVLERLLPKMPPSIKVYPFVYEPGAHHLYLGATAETAFDVFNAALSSTLGFGGYAADAAYLASDIAHLDESDFEAENFAPEEERRNAGTGDEEGEHAHFGREFLTWLWSEAEAHDGEVDAGEAGNIGILVEGPLAFERAGNGAHSVVLSRGAPEVSAEAKTCLAAGKLLKSARLTFSADRDTAWRFQFDADGFVVRAMQMPKGEMRLDAASRFLDRMTILDRWRDILMALYGRFLALRKDTARWRKTAQKIRVWVADMPANC
jgi:hypothetical protein